MLLRPAYTVKVCGTCFWNSNTKQLGDLFQKQKIKGSHWNLCAVCDYSLSFQARLNAIIESLQTDTKKVSQAYALNTSTHTCNIHVHTCNIHVHTCNVHVHTCNVHVPVHV